MLKNIKFSDIGWLKILFVAFVVVYSLLMLIKPSLGPTDDFMLLRTIQSGHPVFYFSKEFPYGDIAKLGRFGILSPMEYNFFGLFMKSPSAFWYYLMHVFQYVLFMMLFVKILSRFTSNRYLIYLTPIILSLTPAMTIPFFRTHMIDRNIILLYAALLYFYFLNLDNSKTKYIVLGLLSVNTALYYRENAFVALFVFAFFHFILTWKKSGKKVKIFDGLIMFSSLLYLLLYYLIIFRHLEKNAMIYTSTGFNILLVSIKAILNFAFFSDPIVILILLPFTAWRLYKFLRKKISLHPIYDSMLLAGSAYAMTYIVLHAYGPNYMLPVYIFALPPLIYFFSQKEQRTVFWKIIAVICGLIMIFNVFPSGLHQLTYYKYFSVNFNKMLDFLINDINTNHPNQKMNIFLAGTDLKGGRTGTYFILADFLEYRKLPSWHYDLKSNVPTPNPDKVYSYIKFPFTVFESDQPSEIHSGDYLIVQPEATKINITKEYIQSLSKDYKLLFRTNSPLAFPNLNLKTLAKYLLSSRLSQTQKDEGVITNENLMRWPDYYVFIKK